MEKSIRKNYLYNVTYQMLLIIIPLITTPYLARVLGADGTGTVSFAESIVSYFVLAATLGMSTYGKREISYVQDDRRARSKVFWNTKSLEFITSIVVSLVYIVFSFSNKNKELYIVLLFNILAVTVDVTWLFQGMENFRSIVIRNVFFKLINVAYIFLFIKEPGDYVKYAFGIGFFLFLSNISLWVDLPKYVDKPNIRETKPFSNMQVILSLFIPTVAIQIYTVLDKTMIGLITKDAFENGYYEQALKMSKIALTIVTALGTVMIPRIGFHYGRGEHEIVQKYMYRGYRFVWCLGIPLCFGLIGISKTFVPWFYGQGYDKVVPLLSILSFLILAIGINNVTGMQYLIPTKRQNIFTYTVLFGAVVNFVLNCILIRYLGSIGAAIASVAAETSIALIQLFLVKKELSFKTIMQSSVVYIIAGIIMFISLKILEPFFKPSMIGTVVLVFSGFIIYFTALLVLRDSFVIQNLKKAKMVISRIKGR